jgi:hypothetical protein
VRHGLHDEERDERVALARRARDRRSARAGGGRVGEALGVHLHDPDMAGAVQPRGDGVVVGGAEERGRVVELRVGAVRVALPQRSQSRQPAGARGQDVVVTGGRLRLPGPRAHVGRVAAPERSDRHLERERAPALGRRVLQRRQQPPARVGVAPEHALDRGAPAHQREPHGPRLRWQQLEHLDERGAALLEAPGARQRDGHRRKQHRAACQVVAGQQSVRCRVPARRGAGRGVLGRRRRRRQQRDRGVVSRPGRLLHVIGLDPRGGVAARERRRRALVRAEPPGRRGGVVHRPAHERVAEAEAPPVARRADEIGGHEHVERDRRVARLEVRGGGRELGVERIAGHRRAVDEGAGGGRKRADLALHGRHQRRGEVSSRRAGGASQLLEEERISRRLLGHAPAQRVVGQVFHQRERGVAGERLEREVAPALGCPGGVEQARRGVDGARREAEQVRRLRRAAQQVEHQLDRRVVGPVQVVEQQDHGALSRQQLEQPAQRAVVAEALGRAGVARECAGGAGCSGGEHGAQVGAERLDAARVQRRDVVVERVDDQAEGDVALVLRAASGQDDHVRFERVVADGPEHRALADACLAEDPKRAA